jgi:hypothetical protein
MPAAIIGKKMSLPTVNVTSSGPQTINTLQNAGQNTMANSHPVVVASDQTSIPVSAASLPLPTGAAQDGTDGTAITPPTEVRVYVDGFPASTIS